MPGQGGGSPEELTVMRCPGCGETNEEGYRFCRNCGRVLPLAETPSPAPVPPAAGESTPTVAMPGPTRVVTPLPAFPPTSRLVATSGLLIGRTFTIGPKGLVIGRDPANCQVVVADDEISRLHAWIGFNDQGKVVERDRHSANGTYVNQVRIQEQVLEPTDE